MRPNQAVSKDDNGEFSLYTQDTGLTLIATLKMSCEGFKSSVCTLYIM